MRRVRTEHPRNIVVSVVLWISVYGQAAAYGAPSQGSAIPWHLVAKEFSLTETFHAAGLSDSASGLLAWAHGTAASGEIVNLAIRPKGGATIPLPSQIRGDPGAPQQVKIDLAAWVDVSWRQIGGVQGAVRSDSVNIASGLAEEGFFRLSLDLASADNGPVRMNAFAIVTSNWKRDFLAYCRQQQEKIERQRDLTLIYASIAGSHWDHVMQMAASSASLSQAILGALVEAERASEDFEAGKDPKLARGLSRLRLLRFPGARIEEFAVVVPETYTQDTPWPVYVHADNRRAMARHKYSQRSGLIDIWWLTVADENIDWKSFDALMEILQATLHLDRNRIYVNGECRDGLAAMSLALTRPDYWAECSSSLTSTHYPLAGNAHNLNMIYVKAGHQEYWELGYYEFAMKCFEYFGCDNLVSSLTLTTEQARGSKIPMATKIERPARVFYSIDSMANPRAHWVRIDGRADESLIGRIDAQVNGQTIYVTTTNVDAYTLYLADAPVNPADGVEIIENGGTLGRVKESLFTRRSDKYANATHVKDEQLHGPVWDVFTDAFVVVTAEDNDAISRKSCEQLAMNLAGGAPCLATAPVHYLATHNIVVVGAPTSTSWASKLHEGLRLKVTADGLSVLDRSFAGPNTGVILIHPNPLNPAKYAAVFTGNSVRAILSLQKAYEQLKSMGPADVGVFTVTGDGGIDWLACERLSTTWDWHAGWDQKLFTVRREHPLWQWRQWIAELLREQFAADVVLCGNPLRFANKLPTGQVTYQDLGILLADDWFVKAELTGAELRRLLVSLSDMPGDSADRPVIQGIAFESPASPRQTSSLQAGAIENAQPYSLVCSYKWLNGARTGKALHEYRFVDQGNLLPALRARLSGLGETDVDAQLDRFPSVAN